MDITCWNCKTVTKLDNAAITAAIQKMDATKLSFFDVPCSNCGKVNRTQRAVFVTALASASTVAASAPVSAPVSAAASSAPKMTQREATRQTKEENARRRGEDIKGDAKKNAGKAKKGR